MMSQLRRTRSKSLFCLSLLLVFLVNFATHAQTSSAPLEPGAPGSNALPFLTELFTRYAHATSYHLEYTEEHQIDSEFSRNWSKVFITSIVGPANHYRFESRGQFGRGVQVSDGETEWSYYGPLNQYTQQPTPSAGPSEVLSAATIRLGGMLRQAQSNMKNFAYLGNLVRTATFVPEQTIEVAGKSMSCIVVTTEGEMPDTQGHITTRFTFWIDKRTKLIRKLTDRREGELTREPGTNYLSSTNRLYQVAELDVSYFPEGTFSFAPPPSAILVKQFEDKQTQELAKLVGKPVPALTLKASGGKEVTLQSLAGKPVLLDFWATWCVPFRESLPALEKLYQENGAKGLVLLSLDEDDDNPQKAADFWAMRKEPWPNFHAGKEIREKFPVHGIPYFVLLDSSGKVTFSQAGLDENSLRAAVATLTSSPTSQSPTVH
jgi:cytochrome c biogenesis protein CcmG, thiol:disulfide interchange protein DsbE